MLKHRTLMLENEKQKKVEKEKAKLYIEEKGCNFFVNSLMNNILSKETTFLVFRACFFISDGYKYNLLKAIANSPVNSYLLYDAFIYNKSSTFRTILSSYLDKPKDISLDIFFSSLCYQCFEKGNTYQYNFKQKTKSIDMEVVFTKIDDYKICTYVNKVEFTS